MVDDVYESNVIRESRMWLSRRIMESHFPSGENCMSRAPVEKDSGRVTLETLRPSSSDLGRN